MGEVVKTKGIREKKDGMASIICSADYEDLPQTVRLVGRLGRGSEILPLRLMFHTAKLPYMNGKLNGYSAQSLEAALKWWGKRGEAELALIEAGWVAKIDGGYQVIDWIQSQRILIAQRIKGRKGGLILNHRRSPGLSPAKAGDRAGLDREVVSVE